METQCAPDARGGASRHCARACLRRVFSRPYRARILVLLASLTQAGPVPAADGGDACTGVVATLPATISTPGTWCIDHDLATAMGSGIAIWIAADDVTLDCNHHGLDSVSTTTHPVGVQAQGRRGITVRRCRFRAFSPGVFLTSSPAGAAHLVEDNHFDASRDTALMVDGDGTVVRRNLVVNTVAAAENQVAYGILATGSIDVLDNTVAGVSADSGMAVGISTRGNHGGSVRGNVVRVRRNGGAGAVVALHNLTGSERMVIRDNTLVGGGQTNSQGIVCDAGSDIAKDNSISGFVDAVFQCTDAGNLVKP
jgi:hypothetical protein